MSEAFIHKGAGILKIGKISESILKRSVLKQIKTKRNEILECNRNTMIRIKQEDFNSFEKVLNIDNVSIAYTSNILDSLSKLKTFEVEQKDIIKVINYFNSLSASADNNVKVPLILYSKEMLNEMIDDCVNFIFEYITSTIIKCN